MAVNYLKYEDNYKITTQEIKKRYKCFNNGNYCIITIVNQHIPNIENGN